MEFIVAVIAITVGITACAMTGIICDCVVKMKKNCPECEALDALDDDDDD